MTLMGETSTNICLTVNSKKHDIRWNLGKVIVVKELTVPLLIGEPGKKDNTIITIPQEVILTKDVSGKMVSLPYHAKKGHHPSGFTRQFLVTVPDNTMLYPNETISVPIPSTFVNNVAILTPRHEFDANWPKPKVINVKKDTIVVENDTNTPILLLKSRPFADLRDMFQTNVNKVYDLHRNDNSHLVLPDRPKVEKKSYIGDVSIDPDNQLSPSWKTKFRQVCEEFSDIITPVPGRYNGYYGRVDNSIHWVSNPPPSIKARLPKYNNEMMA